MSGSSVVITIYALIANAEIPRIEAEPKASRSEAVRDGVRGGAAGR